MADSPSKTLDVLIVGAGPTGLTAAAQLAARGVSCRIVEKLPARDTKSRALVVQARTLELFAKMGLAEAFLAAGKTGMHVNVYVAKERVVSFDLGGLRGVDETPYPFVLFVSEAETERILGEHLAALGMQVERAVELLNFTQNAEGVTAELRRADGAQETVSARYILGCDGAHSQVRHDSGVSFQGAAYAQDFVLGDVELQSQGASEVALDQVHICLPERGLFVILPMAGSSRVRLIASGLETLPDAAVPDPTLADLQALADACGPVPLRLSNPSWIARFRLHHRGVDRYRVDRAFLAGDAAHIHSPAGGQGMNTGIQDSYNLAWKLAMVLHGEAPPHLLDSYHEERWPVGRQLLRFTDRLFALGATQNPLALAARKRLAPRLLRFATATPERRALLFSFISQLAINYRRSHIVGEDFGDGAWRHGPQAGDRAPDGPLVIAKTGAPARLHSALGGLPFHLLYFAGSQPAVEVLRQVSEPRSTHSSAAVKVHIITRTQDPSDHAVLDPSGALHARYGVSHQATYLIRPDGYIAFRAPRIENVHAAAALLR